MRTRLGVKIDMKVQQPGLRQLSCLQGWPWAGVSDLGFLEGSQHSLTQKSGSPHLMFVQNI